MPNELGLNICTQNPELAALQDGSLQQLIFMTIHDNPYLQVAAFLRRVKCRRVLYSVTARSGLSCLLCIG
ncbi:hypothetical protein AcV5_008694 [Taiwanofungus camphoratus]|nr:hypothetical protein AcV5_008694 [Antrodia cinnamomea]